MHELVNGCIDGCAACIFSYACAHGCGTWKHERAQPELISNQSSNWDCNWNVAQRPNRRNIGPQKAQCNWSLMWRGLGHKKGSHLASSQGRAVVSAAPSTLSGSAAQSHLVRYSSSTEISATIQHVCSMVDAAQVTSSDPFRTSDFLRFEWPHAHHVLLIWGTTTMDGNTHVHYIEYQQAVRIQLDSVDV